MSKRPLTLEDLFRIRGPADPQITYNGDRVAFVVSEVNQDEDRSETSIWMARRGSAELDRLTLGPKDLSPRWSPDGSRLAFLRPGDNDKLQLWMLEMRGGEPKCVTSSEHGVSEIAWSPDGRLVGFIEREVWGQKPEGESQRKSAPIVVSRLSFKSDGSGITANHRRHLHVLDPDGTEGPRRVTSGDFNVGSIDWAPDGSIIAFISAMHEDRDLDLASDLFIVSSEGGEPEQVTEPGGSVGSVAFSSDGTSIIYSGQAENRGDRHHRLFAVELGARRTRLLFPDFDRNVMIGGPGYPGGLPHLLADGRVVFCARDGGCTHVYAGSFDDASPEKIIGGDDRVVMGLDVARESGDLAYLIATSAAPAEVFSVRIDGSDETRLSSLNADLLDEVEVLEVETETFTSRDGTAVEAFVLRPKPGGDPGPLLLDIHGGPHNAWTPAFSARSLHHQVLAQEGWTILMPNSRGSDGYGEEFYGSLSGGWGRADMDDFMFAVESLVEDGQVDSEKLAVTGYSYGGFMTNWLISHTDRFAAAVTGGCVTNLVSMFGTCDFGQFLKWEIAEDPLDQQETYSELSPLTYARDVSTPTLILHGMSDDRCPVGQAEEWFSALRRYGQTVEMVLYPNASHLFLLTGPPSQRLDYMRRVVGWVVDHVHSRGTSSVGSEESVAAASPLT